MLEKTGRKTSSLFLSIEIIETVVAIDEIASH